MLETIAQTFPDLEEKRAALGFPDILLEPPDVYRRLIERQDADGADLVMGLFPTDQDERSDMVELDDDGQVRSLVIKQPPRGLEYSWAAGVWTPAFTSFLRDFVDRTDFDDESREVHTSEAVFGPRPGWNVDTVIFEEGRMLDIGTPDGLEQVLALPG